MKLNDKLYDVLKYITIIILPALATLYTGLSQIWGFPYAVEIPATVVCVETFLGAILCISSINYNKDGEQNGK